MNRRKFLFASASALVTLPSATALLSHTATAADTESFEVERTDAQWRAMLSDLEYKVMRHEGTERPGSSPLNKEKRDGEYQCRGCDLPLYTSETKYDSGTGWPSFYEALPNAVATKDDFSFFGRRTEAHCRRCGSHLGHIFEDGPKPTGLRHCINGVSLKFIPS